MIRGHYPQTVGCEPVDISADGGYIACRSEDSNLVPGDTNGDDTYDLFGIDLKTEKITRLDVTSAGQQINKGILQGPFSPPPCNVLKCGGYPPLAVLSGNGHWAAFASAGGNVVPNDSNRVSDVFLRGPLP